MSAPDLYVNIFDIFDVRACRLCGCTDDHACPPTCSWVEEDLCSACLAAAAAALSNPPLPPETAIHAWGDKARQLLASDWFTAVIADAKSNALREALTEIGERARAAQDEVHGADFGTVLTATVNAYSNACRDLAARVEAEAGR